MTLATSRALALATLLGAAASQAWAQASVRVAGSGSTERIEVTLDGALVSALAARPGELLLLVGPTNDVDGPRRLYRLDLGEVPRLVSLATGVAGWTKTLAALELDAGPVLVVGGLGRVDAWGALGSPEAQPRPWLAHPGLDLRSLAPDTLRVGIDEEIAAAESGWLRVWRPEGEAGLRLVLERRLPLEVGREATGLEITSPPVARLARAVGPGDAKASIFSGPEARGGRRVLVTAVDAEGEDRECWLALPAVEAVETSWLVAFDGEPAMVVHAQGGAELNLFENQRYRVFPLVPDRTRAGRAPRLAFEVDTKRWHDTTVTVADADGDGDDDLVLVRPEGMTGGDLVVEVFPGRGGVRFESGSRRTDLDKGPDEWRVLENPGGAPPELATLAAGRLEVWRFAAKGRRALERHPHFAASLQESPGRERAVTVRAGGDGAEVRAGAIPGRTILGAVPTDDGRAVVVLERDESGAERLHLVSDRAR